MKGKIVVSAVSIILVVGVVIGVVVGVKKYGSDAKTQENLSEQMKAISAICAPADYKDLCVQSLSKTAANGTSDPKELIHAAVLATLNSLKNTRNFTSSLNSTKPLVQMALEDCMEMFDIAIDDVQETLSFVKDNDLQRVYDRVFDLRHWLSSVMANDVSCMLGFEENDDKDYMQEMAKSLQDPRQLSANAIAILDQLAKILTEFGIKLNNTSPNPNSRRLLNSEDKYPTWFSEADRKLLADVNARTVVPDAVVSTNPRGGEFSKIADALRAYKPKKHGGRRYIIYVKGGTYQEYVAVPKNKVDVFMYGDGPQKTIVTGSISYVNLEKKYGPKHHRVTTWRTATFSALAKGFLCKDMGFENTAGPQGHQAVAFRGQSDQSAFFNCAFYGNQDTLYIQNHRQFYRECSIYGTVDFIFGGGSGLIQNSQIVVRKPLPNQFNAIAAQGKKESNTPSGIVIQGCNIVADPFLQPIRTQVITYLGRPWQPFATTVFMESDLGDFIHPQGYKEWDTNGGNKDKGYWAEYNNRGKSADVSRRVNWPAFKGVITREQVLRHWTAVSFLQANAWLKDVPYTPELIH